MFSNDQNIPANGQAVYKYGALKQRAPAMKANGKPPSSQGGRFAAQDFSGGDMPINQVNLKEKHY